ncbi:hypothetical protein FQN60_002843 [Etheostoma spectabile]|uniref:Uncharacterized protein n=1 Tax=Etheostoma spectabile TaxID=54343 RepID=A0A5J5CH88_9PERO|nr:hypothetical protein FQN60_002843 [Etheostoma spectabile]
MSLMTNSFTAAVENSYLFVPCEKLKDTGVRRSSESAELPSPGFPALPLKHSTWPNKKLTPAQNTVNRLNFIQSQSRSIRRPFIGLILQEMIRDDHISIFKGDQDVQEYPESLYSVRRHSARVSRSQSLVFLHQARQLTEVLLVLLQQTRSSITEGNT